MKGVNIVVLFNIQFVFKYVLFELFPLGNWATKNLFNIDYCIKIESSVDIKLICIVIPL